MSPSRQYLTVNMTNYTQKENQQWQLGAPQQEIQIKTKKINLYEPKITSL
jgi:hypothetical protein